MTHLIFQLKYFLLVFLQLIRSEGDHFLQFFLQHRLAIVHSL